MIYWKGVCRIADDVTVPQDDAARDQVRQDQASQSRTMAAKRLMRRRLHTLNLAAALLLAVGLIFLYASYRSLTNKIQQDDGYYYPGETAAQEEITGLAVDIPNADAHALNAILREWAKNDVELKQDKAVMNILLCGVDSDSGEALGGRSDAIILATINRREKAITLTSILRDSYSYIDLSRDTDHPRILMDRVNAAYSLGGPATLMDTLEANYKIVIDNYISVDFKTFPRIIDDLKGVRVNVTQEEADYINRASPRMEGKFPAGRQVRLDGEQALVFTRIRMGDAREQDSRRTARQRQVISAIIRRAKDASPGELLDTMRRALRHVVTDLNSDDIDRLSKEAILQGWFKYELRQLSAPCVGNDGAATGVSTYIGSKWLWIVDYPRDAQRLQLALYGDAAVGDEQTRREDYLSRLVRERVGNAK